MILNLPVELLLELAAHLDLNGLLKLLLAFQELLPLVRLYRDFDKLNVPFKNFKRRESVPVVLDRSIKEIIPDVAVLGLSKLKLNGSRINIVELYLSVYQENLYSVYLENLYSGNVDITEATSDMNSRLVIWKRCQAVASAIQSRHTFVRLVGSAHNGLEAHHTVLARACKAVGATLSYGSLPTLDFSFGYNYPAPPPKEPHFFSRITSIQINGLSDVSIPTLASAVNLQVVLESVEQARGNFRLALSPRLRKLSIHYKGTRVPYLTVAKDSVFFNHVTDGESGIDYGEFIRDLSSRVGCRGCCTYSDECSFELKRVATYDELKSGIMCLSEDGGDKRCRLGLRSLCLNDYCCCCLTLDGTPDWVLQELDIRYVTSLNWKRWRYSGFRVLTPQDALHTLARIFRFVTDIENYTLPTIHNSHLFYPALDKEVNIVAHAYGLSLNGLLCANKGFPSSLSISCPPYHPHKEPLCIEEQDARRLVKQGACYIHLSGHVIIGPFDPVLYRAMPVSKIPGAYTNITFDITSQLAKAYKMGDGGLTFTVGIFSFGAKHGPRYIQLTCQDGFFSSHLSGWVPFIHVQTPSCDDKRSNEVVISREIQRHTRFTINDSECKYPTDVPKSTSLFRWRPDLTGVTYLPEPLYTFDE